MFQVCSKIHILWHCVRKFTRNLYKIVSCNITVSEQRRCRPPYPNPEGSHVTAPDHILYLYSTTDDTYSIRRPNSGTVLVYWLCYIMQVRNLKDCVIRSREEDCSRTGWIPTAGTNILGSATSSRHSGKKFWTDCLKLTALNLMFTFQACDAEPSLREDVLPGAHDQGHPAEEAQFQQANADHGLRTKEN